MKKLTALWFFCLFTFAFCLASYAGQWTANGYFYKPSMGASGETEYNLFNQGLDRADAELAALDPSQISATPPLTYNSATGVLAIPRASATVNGYLGSTDWSTFNAKQPAITPGTTSQYWRGDKTWQLLDAGAVNIGEIWVGDPDYGSTIQAAITSINSIFSPPTTLHVPAGTYTFSSSYTIPANITLALENGAILSIPSGVTLTINGPFQPGLGQVFSGAGSVVFGYPSKVATLYPQWWGAQGDDSNDDTAALNAMTTCSAASGGVSMYCPAGTYKITSTVYIGPSSTLGGCIFGGAGGNQAFGGQLTNFDASAITSGPAINVQNARFITIKDIAVNGCNAAPATAAHSYNGHMSPVLADWITPGCANTQMNPYTGIGVSGASSPVILDEVSVYGFVVGVGMDLFTAYDNTCGITVRDSEINNCAYGFSTGNTQDEGLAFYNTWLSDCWDCFTVNTHGGKTGHYPNIYDGGCQVSWKVFEGNPDGPFHCSGVWMESIGWLGNVSGGQFTGCYFCYPGPGSGYFEPYFFTSEGGLSFTHCTFDFDSTRAVWNFFNFGLTTFTECGWYNAPGACVFFGLNAYINTQQSFLGYSFNNCAPIQPAAGPLSSINLNNELITCPLTYRCGIAPWTHTLRVWGASGFTNYHVNVLPGGRGAWLGCGFSPNMTVSSASVTGTDHNAALTFTAAIPGEWAVGDVIFWPVMDRDGLIPAGCSNKFTPAFQVTAINSGTGVVTASSLADNIDTSYVVPGWLNTAMPCFINNTAATGNTTNGSASITSVTNISNFLVGDWIQGSGVLGRITAISGTTITLSRAASATANGVSIYNCQLTATDMTYPGAGVANSTGSAWGTSYQVGTAANNLVQLNGSAQLPAVDGSQLTNLSPGSVAGETFPASGLIAGTTDTQTLTNKTLTSPTLTTPALGTPASGNLANCTFPTLNQNTTGQAGTVATINGLITAGSNVTLSGSGTAASPYSISSSGGGGGSYTFSDSLVNNSGTVTLVNDSASPGDSYYYGTNSSGTLGYNAIPTVSDSIVLNSGAVSLSGDSAAPGNLTFYGTNGSGTNGWYAQSGIAAGSLAGTQTANYIYAAPNGSSGTASFRAMVAADVPTLNQNTTGAAGSVTGETFPASGLIAGTTDTQTLTNKTLTSPTLTTPALGTPASGNLANCTFPTLNQNTTGMAAGFTGSLSGDVTGTQSATSVGKINGVSLPTLASATGLLYDSSGTLSLQSTLPTAAEPAHTGDVTNTAGSLAMTVGKINGTSLAGLATGILKNTTSTGVPSIAVAGTDYVSPSGNITGQAGTVATINGLISAGSNITLSGSGTSASPYSISSSGGGGGGSYTFSDSLVNSSGAVTLVNDSASPGCSYYYGTNSSGTLGYNAIPTVSDSITLSGGSVLLSGDSASPGNLYFYGTNSSGTKGWLAQSSIAAGSLSGSQTANYIYAAPNGSSGTAAFRALVAADVPTLNQNTTGTAAGLSGSQTANYVYAAPNGSSGTASFRALVNADLPAAAYDQKTGTTSPTAPASTSAYAMQGLAGAITPTKSGNVLITICGTIIAPSGTTVDNGIKYQISYGTGTAPSNGGTLTGTQVGVVQEWTNPVALSAAADLHVPFSVSVVVTGLTVNTAYWIDLAAESVTTASDIGFSNVGISAHEF